MLPSSTQSRFAAFLKGKSTLVPLFLTFASILAGTPSWSEDFCPALFERLLVQSGFPTATYRSSSRELQRRIAENLRRTGLREPYRQLSPSEVSVAPMNEGQSFDYAFEEYISSLKIHPTPGRAIGTRISFRTAEGNPHTIELFAPEGEAAALEAMTQEVLGLPADALSAVHKFEFSPNGYENLRGLYPGKGRVLLLQGRNEGTLSHEFGHAVAQFVWGKANPYKEWNKAFRADGRRFVTPYARKGHDVKGTGFSEDFAESVKLYLLDPDEFAKEFPNRAALLDTIFRSTTSPFGPGGVWAPRRTRYGSVLFPAWRFATGPVPLVLFGVSAVGAGATWIGVGMGEQLDRLNSALKPLPSAVSGKGSTK